VRHRRVDPRIWLTDPFRSLSPLLPGGEALYLYLLTGPHAMPLPGVVLLVAGLAGFAEALGWPLAAVDAGIRELTGCGLAEADLDAGLIWLPRALLADPPQSCNVVKSWRVALDSLPASPLKLRIYTHVSESLAWRPAFLAAWGKLPATPACQCPSGCRRRRH
jgi:hypothetical protein